MDSLFPFPRGQLRVRAGKARYPRILRGVQVLWPLRVRVRVRIRVRPRLHPLLLHRLHLRLGRLVRLDRGVRSGRERLVLVLRLGRQREREQQPE